MKMLSNILLVVGTIVGALGGAQLPEANWTVALAGVGILTVGAVFSRMVRRLPSAADIAGPRPANARELLDRLCGEIDSIEAEIDSLTVDRLAEKLRVLDSEQIRPLARAVPGFLRDFGGARFAEIFGPYASGERLIGRAWSAATDRHHSEAVASFREGAARIRQACRFLDAKS